MVLWHVTPVLATESVADTGAPPVAVALATPARTSPDRAARRPARRPVHDRPRGARSSQPDHPSPGRRRSAGGIGYP
jgi:hypothetical protein